MDELDEAVLRIAEEATPGIGLADASLFLMAMRKIAAGPDEDLLKREQEVATGEAPTPDEAAAHTQAAEPDISGRLEGEFAASIPDVVAVLAQIVSNGMRQHTAYAFYGEMMRDLGRGELAELFDEQSEGEVKEMHYFLRRMSVLQPGGVPIPVAPTPEPSSNPTDALRYLIAGEQQAIVLFKTLHAMLGENPMKYTLEQIMTDAQEHMDKLWQYMPAVAPQAKQAAKLARAMKLAMEQDASPLEIVSKERMLQEAQLMNENVALKQQVAVQQQQMVQQQNSLESMGAENQTLAASAQGASDMAQQAQLSAQANSEMAAQQADAKMRLAMRIQQLRQQLADIVTADPVQEEGESAQPVMTANQATPEEQMMAEQAQAQATGGPKAKKEVAQAQRAQSEAAQQTSQAQAAAGGVNG